MTAFAVGVLVGLVVGLTLGTVLATLAEGGWHRRTEVACLDEMARGASITAVRGGPEGDDEGERADPRGNALAPRCEPHVAVVK